jgi:hypothetical protein
MVHRYRNQLTIGLSAFALLAVLTPLLPASGAVESLYSQISSTSTPPRLQQQTEDIVTLRWVFRPGDLMSCRTSARDLRHARLAFGDRVQIHAVAVGSDVEYVQSFLRGERLQAEVVTISERDYRRNLSSVPTPSVALVRAGHTLELFAAGNLQLPGRPSTSTLNQVLASLFGTVPQT